MSTPTSITIPIASRYKDTPVYIDPAGNLAFELQIAPPEFDPQALAGATQHRVSSSEVGFMDLIAVQYFGTGYEPLWWGVAQANGIIDPERETYAGQGLAVPPRANADTFLGRQGNAAAQG